MSLIKSISGIRGTIGGQPGESLSPIDIVSFVSAFGQMTIERSNLLSGEMIKVVVGRDARTSGPFIQELVSNTLLLMGIDIIDLGLATTPTVEMAVTFTGSQGGIILTASHNPGNWNALKLLNSKGEFLSNNDGIELLEKAASAEFIFAEVENIGTYSKKDFLKNHIESILALPLVKKESIEKADFSIVVDAVNSVGGIAIPELLKALGVNKVKCLNCEPNGLFSHAPEPLPENLKEISEELKSGTADLGIVVDPDVDRLALVCENGDMFGEEYTLVAVSDYVLSHTPGSTVSNLSSSRALKDVSRKYGCEYFSSAVGEVNVVEEMKKREAVIGGEGNGGIIYPELHYGRDALVGIALFLSHLASKKQKMSDLKSRYPKYFISKKKIQLNDLNQADEVLNKMREKYDNHNPDLRDGIKIDLPSSWIHLRKSNTEPIMRIYVEAQNENLSEEIAVKVLDEISGIINNL